MIARHLLILSSYPLAAIISALIIERILRNRMGGRG